MPGPIITLTTDFGLSDMYVGTMKGVILGIAPDAQIIDLTHNIAPQNVLEASSKLAAAIGYFPRGTIHVAVVDPGVGSTRSALIVETDAAYFVAPDNGLLTLPLQVQPPIRVIRLAENAQRFCLSDISATFHGRDIFAPTAAHIAAGAALEAFGDDCPKNSLVTCTIPGIEPTPGNSNGSSLQVPVLYKDHFGNLITNLTFESWRAWITELGLSVEEANRSVKIQVGQRRWHGLSRTYSEVEPGLPLAYWGSAQTLEIAIREGNAAVSLAFYDDTKILLSLDPRTIIGTVNPG